MKKIKESKKSNSTKPKPLDVCETCTSNYCAGTTNPKSKKRSNLTPRSSKSSISTKTSKISINASCYCGAYLDHAAMLDTPTDDSVCSCGIFAQALRSNIHMNIGTFIHEGKPATEDIVETNRDHATNA